MNHLFKAHAEIKKCLNQKGKKASKPEATEDVVNTETKDQTSETQSDEEKVAPKASEDLDVKSMKVRNHIRIFQYLPHKNTGTLFL